MARATAQGPASVAERRSDPSQLPLLVVRDLRTYFETRAGVVRAVDGVDFDIGRGEVFGIVGESGCGKTVTALSILRLLDYPGRIVSGEIIFDGIPLFELSARRMRRLRGRRISMIFQQPEASLNPVFRVGDQVADVFQIHGRATRREAQRRAVELLEIVGIPAAVRRSHAYPHELSGGMAQRVMIAIALALDPDLLIADEPTTALDVTIQAQILDLLRELQRRSGTSIVLISHDLAVVAEMADRVAVMYAGRIVEQAAVRDLFAMPLHPYTKGLIAATPLPGRPQPRLQAIPGSVPSLLDETAGCRFADRCHHREEFSLSLPTEREPDLVEIAPGHRVRCWLYQSHGEHRAPLAVSRG